MPDPLRFEAEGPISVDLGQVTTVIFTGGYRPDYANWVDFPYAFDESGFPMLGRRNEHGGLRPTFYGCPLPEDATVLVNRMLTE
jgi:hypothetical protein